MLNLDTLRPYKDGDLDNLDPRPIDLRLAGPEWKENIAKNIRMGEVVTAQKDGEVLAITGLVNIRPGVAEIWSITGNAVDKYKILFAKASIVVVDFWIREHNLHRLQANVHHEHTRSIKWLAWLGFECEGLMRQFGLLREDFFLYARVNERDN